MLPHRQRRFARLLQLALLARPSRRALLAAAALSLAAEPARAALPAEPSEAAEKKAPADASPNAADEAAREFVSGLIAGAAQKTVKELALHPFDTAKVRLQLDPANASLRDPALYADLYSGIGPAVRPTSATHRKRARLEAGENVSKRPVRSKRA